jgi:cytidylate kinase
LADVHARDARDTGRADAPLLRAPDAILLDNSDMPPAAAIAAAIAFVEEKVRRPS